MKTPSLQEHLFGVLLERYPSRTELVDDLCKILSLGKDAIYRRLRAESILTPDQMALLARHYRLSLDSLIFRETNTVLFTFNAFDKEVKSFDDYFQGILDHLKKLLAIPDVRIWYASLEIPIFYYCFYPELIAFKLYVWGRAIWDIPFTRQTPFRPDLIPPSALERAGELLQLYLQIPSLQMWSLNIFDNTLNQIAYHWTSGQIRDREDALMLLDRLEQLTQHMGEMAAAGAKMALGSSRHHASLELFHNEMIYTNNTILVESPWFNGVFSAFGNPNFLFSNDARIVAYTRHWFEGVLSRSQPLTLGSEKHRNWFFGQLREKVQIARKRMAGEVLP